MLFLNFLFIKEIWKHVLQFLQDIKQDYGLITLVIIQIFVENQISILTLTTNIMAANNSALQ